MTQLQSLASHTIALIPSVEDLHCSPQLKLICQPGSPGCLRKPRFSSPRPERLPPLAEDAVHRPVLHGALPLELV